MSKNIVLLSDGTGNSAAKPFKTNVWRLYQALGYGSRRQNPGVRRQIVYYDNGVGTENFKPLALLGGAFGLGVWSERAGSLHVRLPQLSGRRPKSMRSVSAVAHSPFGFSGMIGECGSSFPTARHESDQEAVQMAYRAFRRDFLVRASKQRGT